MDVDFHKTVRAARMKFLDEIEPHRGDLYRYCRGLTGSVWDAEDLAQETLLRAFGKLAEAHWNIDRPRHYLLRMATNAWIDRSRREQPDELPETFDAPGPETASSPEVREAFERLARVLPPRERAAVLLADVFGFTLEETAAQLATTVGAVKAALHRARGKLASAKDAPARASARDALPDALIDRFVRAFNARDLDGLSALFVDDAQARVIGMVQEYGREQIAKGSLHHTIFDEEGAPTVERATLRGEPVLLVWYDRGARAVEDVIRLRGDAAGIVSLDYYYFCPEALGEIGAELSVPIRTNGHRYVPRLS